MKHQRLYLFSVIFIIYFKGKEMFEGQIIDERVWISSNINIPVKIQDTKPYYTCSADYIEYLEPEYLSGAYMNWNLDNLEIETFHYEQIYETKDLSRQEQMALGLQFMDSETLRIREESIEFAVVQNLRSEGHDQFILSPRGDRDRRGLDNVVESQKSAQQHPELGINSDPHCDGLFSWVYIESI
ncbi:hypothetical protein QYM36_008360 [Artemia franciscana]|uniref:Uncharacterized protein n=1 Tax=Artemia franciscana TaxID=6661 RepID=A0AA88IGE6_ARTSF|nr:hypothetical protein QYM36_008360 [Artemia franciscana]